METQLTHELFGHCINTTQCVSPCGRYIVYDTRGKDNELAACGSIRVLDLQTGIDSLVYQTYRQSEYGPGVGAATWSPDGKKLLFLGGIQNANAENPYSFTRRTGIAVEWDRPNFPIWMDARQLQLPTTPGALRGGTHAHSWHVASGWVSFTYNDHLLAEAAKHNTELADLRTVGVMFPKEVQVPFADGVENKNGSMYSVLIAAVVKDPRPGSDEVNRAFDECWIGDSGYLKDNGQWQHKAIAYQGQVIDEHGREKAEIFVADIPENLPEQVQEFPPISSGTAMPSVPACITSRRITFTTKGISKSPRHWLRSSADGNNIAFLAEDESGIVQLWLVSPSGKNLRQLSHFSKSVMGPFNFSADGNYIACMCADQIWTVRIEDGMMKAHGEAGNKNGDLCGAVIWLPDGRGVFYNRMVKQGGQNFMQIFKLEVTL